MEGGGRPDSLAPMANIAVLPPEPNAEIQGITEHAAVAKPINALTPPTSEEMNHNETKQESQESDLSDLDLDEEIEDIEPDHYWDGGKVPVFKPTMEQFRDFKRFVERIDRYGMKSGIVKVIPPTEWRQSLPKLDEYVKRIKIKNPITQEFNGTQGIYTQQNVEKQRSYTLPEWKALTEETQHQPPAKRGERRRNQEKVVRGGGIVRGRGTGTIAEDNTDQNDTFQAKRRPGRPRRIALPSDGQRVTEAAADRRGSREPVKSTSNTLIDKSGRPARPGKPKGRPSKSGGLGQTKSVTSRRLNNTAESADYVDEAAFRGFEYGMEDLDEFTPERCAELETHYWKSLGFNQPMYAADMPGSLFDDKTHSWNVAKLENLLDVLGTKVPGVNTAYLYMGMWKATFAWHLEDVDLYSINYIHFGAPKQWYSISQEDARKFEKAMKSVWPVDAKNCDQFLRHKTYLISPDVLQKQYGVKVNKLVHYEGEFVITFPYGYHSGYNLGYNCAESVNFATESWLEFGRIARKCNCEADNVWVDVAEIERKLRGEPTPEYYEETDDDSDLDEEDGNLPSPPASVKGKSATKKRKRGTKQEPPKKKKKKIRIKIRTSTREPCCMCPNDNSWEPLLEADNGKKAHRACALYTPETWIEKLNGVEHVCGVSTIDRARLDLKCNFCRSKRGACFQCSSRKCTRAFHATCALAAGVQVDAGMVPTFGEDGTEYYEEGYDFRCKYHRPKMTKNVNIETLETSRLLRDYAKELKPNAIVQAQLLGGEVFAGLVIENRPCELSVLVDVLPDGNRTEIEWKWLCVLDPDDSQRPKPSSSAIAMPVGMNKNAVSLNNRQDGVPTQDQPFHDNAEYKWHDFFNNDMPPPGYLSSRIQPTKYTIAFDGDDSIFYYLPKVSTEAKVFFTSKPGSEEIDSRANFIERAQSRPSNQNPTPRNQNRLPFGQTFPDVHKTSTEMRGLEWVQTPKPYVYKPKELARSQLTTWNVDRQALANQRGFPADSSGSRRASSSQGSDGPLKSFPTEQYYSMKMLPAAYPGEHSGFRAEARKQSHGSRTIPRPALQLADDTSDYQCNRQQQDHIFDSKSDPPTSIMTARSVRDVIPQAPMPLLPSSVHHMQGCRPSSSSSRASLQSTPLTPATTHSNHSVAKIVEGVTMSQEYLHDLEKYPYLMRSFCRKAHIYESPYPLEGGFSPAYQQASHSGDHGFDTLATSIPALDDSVAPTSNFEGPLTSQWSPPLELWAPSDSAAGKTSHSQRKALYSSHQHPQPVYSTPQEFKQQIQSLPSTASRDGAQARMLRDQGYKPHQAMSSYQRGNYGHEVSRMWYSPKAPVASPLSDPNTPRQGIAAGDARSCGQSLTYVGSGEDSGDYVPPLAHAQAQLHTLGEDGTWQVDGKRSL